MSLTRTDRLYARRLLKLADFLSTLPRKRFNYGTWVGSNWKGKQDLSCGTTGCALGWAATMPSFRKLGLKLDATKVEGTNYLRGEVLHKNGTEGSMAGEAVFGPLAHRLFIPGQGVDEIAPSFGDYSLGGNATPKQVAKLIRCAVSDTYGIKQAKKAVR